LGESIYAVRLAAMIVCIDATSILPPRTGVGVYAASLVQAMARLRPQWRFRLFINSLRRPLPGDPFLRLPNVAIRRLRLPGPLLMACWRRTRFPPWEWLAGPADIAHFASASLAPARKTFAIATVHDLYAARHPEDSHARGGAHWLATLRRRQAGIARFIVPSHAVAQDLQSIMAIAPSRMRVIPEGVDGQRFHPLDSRETARILARFDLVPGYILAVGTLEPRKNYDTLLRAYARLAALEPAAPSLAIAGAEGWKTEAIGLALRQAGPAVAERIRFLGYADAGAMPALYAAAGLFVFPSKDEGFGLPLLEAMACGVPALVSDAPALAELAAGAAATAPALDAEAWAFAIRRLLASPGERARLSQAGQARAALFSWERCAQRTLEVYEECAV